MRHRSLAELTQSLEHIAAAPTDVGTLTMLVRRPQVDEREILDEGQLDVADGLVGDNWLSRATSWAIADGRHLKAQLNVMSARMVSSLAESPTDQAMAGDQLFIDLDLSLNNLPVGTRLQIGGPEAGPETGSTVGGPAVIEVTDKPHNGCAKFAARFGESATEFVNSEVGKQRRLRGLNARVVTSGTVRPGDTVRVVSRP